MTVTGIVNDGNDEGSEETRQYGRQIRNRVTFYIGPLLRLIKLK